MKFLYLTRDFHKIFSAQISRRFPGGGHPDINIYIYIILNDFLFDKLIKLAQYIFQLDS